MIMSALVSLKAGVSTVGFLGDFEALVLRGAGQLRTLGTNSTANARDYGTLHFSSPYDHWAGASAGEGSLDSAWRLAGALSICMSSGGRNNRSAPSATSKDDAREQAHSCVESKRGQRQNKEARHQDERGHHQRRSHRGERIADRLAQRPCPPRVALGGTCSGSGRCRRR